MAKLLQLRGGTTSQHSSFTGAVKEVTVDTDKDVLVVHDGSTAGGFPAHRDLKGADIASADPLVIVAGSNYYIVTGTTGFNDMTVAANHHFFLEFAASLTMTHVGGALDLPSAAPIVTAAGDVGEFFATAANVVTCVNYTRADGSSIAIKNESIDSDAYVDASIDTAHIGLNQIDETLMKDAFVGDFTDATVTASDYFIHGDATDSGNTKKDTIQGIIDLVPASGLPSSTVAVFFQAGAPTGWTKSTANNDKMLRVVSGTGGGTGGTAAISSPAHSISAAAHTLATSEMPAHTHTAQSQGGAVGFDYHSSYSTGYPSAGNSGSTGGGGSHVHSGTGSITTPAYMDVIIATKD